MKLPKEARQRIKEIQGTAHAGMQQVMKEAEMKEELCASKMLESSGFLVEVTVDGLGKPISFKVDPSIIDPEDLSILEKEILLASEDAYNKALKLRKELMSPPVHNAMDVATRTEKKLKL